MPLISVIIPCYNLAAYVGEAIRSVKDQIFRDWECVIVNDGSTDESHAAILEEILDPGTGKIDPRFIYVSQPNHGVAAARNGAISLAHGRYILPLDADDRLRPSALGAIADGFASDPTAAIAIGYVHRFGGDERKCEHRWKSYEELKWRNFIPNSSAFRKCDWKRVGGYRDGTMYEDWEFWLRLLYKNDRAVDLRKVIIDYRVRPGSRVTEAMKRDAEEREIARRMNPAIYGDQLDEADMADKILVVIPYLASGAQGNELELAVAGWERHCKEPHQVVIIGDVEDLKGREEFEGCYLIDCPRIAAPAKGMQYLPHLDIVHKFLKVREAFPHHRGFVYACDDMYAVSDFDLTDIKSLKIDREAFHGSWISTNLWQIDNAKTADLLIARGLPNRSYVCHLPVWYDWDKLLTLYDQLDAEHESYVWEQIYFNYYYKDRVPRLLDPERDDVRLRIADHSFTRNEIRHAIGKTIWIYNTVEGWSNDLAVVLREHYEQ